MSLNNVNIGRFLQNLQECPPFSHGVWVDHRPFKYACRDFVIFSKTHNLPFRTWQHRTKIKIAERYVHIVSASDEELPRRTCGHQFQTVGFALYTTPSRFQLDYLKSRMRGIGLQREYVLKMLN